jgi:hypothetical protein
MKAKKMLMIGLLMVGLVASGVAAYQYATGNESTECCFPGCCGDSASAECCKSGS